LHPYRDAALVKAPAVPPLRRWRGAAVLAAITAGAAVIDVVAGFPLFLTMMTLSYGGATLAVLGTRHQRRAQAMLASLGNEIHATRGVVCARVAWGPGGPVRGTL
jgi:hypothetical protein